LVVLVVLCTEFFRSRHDLLLENLALRQQFSVFVRKPSRNHAFRRFRNTFLRNYTPCPDGLQKFWLGHAGETMTILYDKVKEVLQFRLEWAEKCGVGFELAEFGLSVVPKVPNNEDRKEAACAA
jgi:hypothetical protein